MVGSPRHPCTSALALCPGTSAQSSPRVALRRLPPRMLLWLPVAAQLFAAPWGCMVVPSWTVGTCQVHWQGAVRGAMNMVSVAPHFWQARCAASLAARSCHPPLRESVAVRWCAALSAIFSMIPFAPATEWAPTGVHSRRLGLSRCHYWLGSVVRSGELGQEDIGVLAVDLAAWQLLEGRPSSHLSKRGRPIGPLSRGMRSHLGRRPGC